MPLLLFVIYLTYSSYVGVSFSKKLRWHRVDSIVTSGLIITTGLAFAPFILGLFAVSVLFFFPGYSASFHLTSVMLLLLFFHGLTFLIPKSPQPMVTRQPWSIVDLLLLGFLLFTIGLLFFDSFHYLVAQNDALEYMTIARQLFISHNLLSYPMLNQEQTASGFYGPFTHPPLYVSLLYLMSIIQGHAKQPGLAKLVSPWFATAGCLLVTSLAATINRRTGLLAGLLFILTPLLFLGASSALIDPLPVLGLLLPVTLYYALSDDCSVKWVVVGLAVGCGLWTHSEGVLILPILFGLIFLHNGFPSLRETCLACCSILIAASLIGIWPYIHNYHTLHAVVSDNSRIFTLPLLEWPQYFSYARGLNTLTAKIQYGIFKGWSSPEAYGLTYFLMLLAFLKISVFKIYQMKKVDFSQRLPLIATAIFIMFMSVVLLSVFSGSVLIIKNERYFLLIQSAICLLAAFGLESLLKNRFRFLLTLPLLFLVLSQVVPIFLYKITKGVVCRNPSLVSFKPSNLRSNDCRPNLGSQEPGIYQQLMASSKVPINALIFSQHPAQMYYLDRRMISYLDPRLEPFYNARSVSAAEKALKNLGITHVELANYSLPTHFNSFIIQILEDPKRSTLIDSYQFNDIFTLKPEMKHPVLVNDLTPGVVPWVLRKKYTLIPRKPHSPPSIDVMDSATISDNRKLDFHEPLKINQRHFSHFLIVNTGSLLMPGDEYQLTFDLSGEGFVRLASYTIDADAKLDINKKPLKHIINHFKIDALSDLFSSKNYDFNLMGELVLSKSRGVNHFSKRFYPSKKELFIAIEVMGNASIKVDSVKLYKLEQPKIKKERG